jgi:hypothetical protein
MSGSLHAAGDLVDVDELQIRPRPAGTKRQSAHAPETVDADSRHD